MSQSLKNLVNWLRNWPKNLREPTIFRAVVALGIAFILAVIFYQNGKSLDIGQLFDLKLAITLALVEVPILMFTPIFGRIIFDEARKDAEAKKKLENEEEHKQDIVTLLNYPAGNGFIEYRNGQIFPTKFMWIEKRED